MYLLGTVNIAATCWRSTPEDECKNINAQLSKTYELIMGTTSGQGNFHVQHVCVIVLSSSHYRSPRTLTVGAGNLTLIESVTNTKQY